MSIIIPKENGKFEGNKNIYIINMSKKLTSNISFLQGFLRNAKPDIKPKISNLIDLYGSRKISNLTTVENMIMKLRIADPKVKDANQNSIKKANQKYDKLVTKYENLEPLNVRMLNTKNKNKAVKVARVAQRNTASLKISKLFKNSVRISVTKKESAMGNKVVDMTLNFDYIGEVLKYDMPSILARAFLRAKKELNTKLGFKFYSTIRLWITKLNEDREDIGGLKPHHVYSGDFQSNQTPLWLDTFREKMIMYFKAEMLSI